jgi:hypothetical protein
MLMARKFGFNPRRGIKARHSKRFLTLSTDWEELQKTLDKQAKRAPALTKAAMQSPMTLLQREAKKNIPDRGRGWKKKYGQESRAMKDFIIKHVRVNKKKGTVWGGTGVKAGKIENYNPKGNRSKGGKPRTHIPWNIDHLIEFGFMHKQSGKFIPPHPFLRKAKKEHGANAIKLLSKNISDKIRSEFVKRKRTTKAPFR